MLGNCVIEEDWYVVGILLLHIMVTGFGYPEFISLFFWQMLTKASV